MCHAALNFLDQLFKHQLQFVSLYRLFRLWILYSAPFILLFEEGVDVFKEYGCSKTERDPEVVRGLV